MRLSRSSAVVWPIIAALIPLSLYLLTLCRTVYCGDSGELALAATTLQIAHPPGYPLLTNLGHVWTEIWFFFRPILALNILTAFFAAVAAAVVYSILNVISENDSHPSRLINLALSVMFALGQTLWSVATSFEVYSLAALFAALILAMLVRSYLAGDRKLLLLSGYLFGLSLCNHLSVGSLGLMLVIALWFQRKNLSASDWLIGIGLIILPLTFYGYLYVRSAFDLVLKWYDPQTLWGLKQHLTAQTYQRYVTSPHLADLFPYLIGLGRLLSKEFVWPFVLLAFPGVYLQFRRDSKLASMLLSVVVVNCGLNFNYLIPDITPYFLPTILIVVIWIAEFLQWLSKRGTQWASVAVVTALLITTTTAVGNFAKSDISGRYSAEQYAHDLFEQVPNGGILFCGSDNSMFPTIYLHYAEGYRPDCKVYGHLPTLTRLREDLGLKGISGFNKFPDLMNYALTHIKAPLVFAREPMHYVNDFRTIAPTLVEAGLVYYPDSLSIVPARSSQVDWRNPPKLYDQKEAMLYVVYDLVYGEELVGRDDPEGERLWLRATETVGSQRNFALSNELASYFISAGNLRLARRTLEAGLSIPELRFEQRLRLLESLGSVTFESGDENKAKKLFEEVERMDPSSSIAKYHLLALEAGEAVRTNRIGDAIMTYRQMLQVYPQQREVNLRLGELLLRTGDTTAAKAMFDTCLKDNYRVDYVQKLLK